MTRAVALRVDASTAMGTGHVMRCLTLAQGLSAANVRSHFICREHDGALCDLIEQRGFDVSRLPRASSTEIVTDGTAHANWLGAHWRTDSQQSAAAIAKRDISPEWLIVDHYGIDQRWERELRSVAPRIMAIDDLADRPHDCNLLLDQNLVDGMESRYAERVPADSITLLGPTFALLQPVYAELRRQVRVRSGSLGRLLISFGGADQDNLTGRSLAACLQLQRADIEIDVVITNSMKHAASVREQAAPHAHIKVHHGLPTLAHLMANADLAIGAAGITSWERLCLGLPTLVVTLADNQRAPARKLHDAGLIRWLGDAAAVDQSELFAALDQLTRKGLDEDWSRRCFEAVDGLGLQRVCASLLLTADTPLRVRHANAADEHLLLVWANEPVTRRNAFSTDPISAETHHRWLRRRLEAPATSRIYIAETESGVPVGQVRFERGQDAWVISYSLDAAFRGRGCGRTLLRAALQSFGMDRPGSVVTGQVKAANRSSCRIFETLGFRVIANDGEVLEYRRAV